MEAKHVNKKKVQQARVNQSLWARVCMCMHRACIRSPSVCVRILVCKQHVHAFTPKNPNLVTAKQKHRNKKPSNLNALNTKVK